MGVHTDDWQHDAPYVVLADVIGSRALEDRAAFQETIDAALETVNDRYGESIRTPFGLIKGIDEFGGVLGAFAPIYEVMATVLDRVHPVVVRFGVAQGQIDVGRPGDPITELDGPAFHTAGERLEALDDTDLYVGVETDRAFDPLVENTLNLLVLHRAELTERQVEVIRMYERHGTQQAAATALGVPQQSISKTLQRAEYNRTRVIREQLRDALEGLYD